MGRVISDLKEVVNTLYQDVRGGRLDYGQEPLEINVKDKIFTVDVGGNIVQLDTKTMTILWQAGCLTYPGWAGNTDGEVTDGTYTLSENFDKVYATYLAAQEQ